jgi:HD superfamily phosphohydrolase
MGLDIFQDQKCSEVQALLAPARAVTVFPGQDFHLNHAETHVLRTTPVQRMGRLRQVGLGFIAWPTAEHTRLAHCIGTAYWAEQLLSGLGLQTNSGPGPKTSASMARMRQMEALLGPRLSLKLLIRLYAIVHDMCLLPLCHTLRFELGYFREPREIAKRLVFCIDRVRAELREAPFVTENSRIEPDEIRHTLLHHLDLLECVLNADTVDAPGDWIAPSSIRADLMASIHHIAPFVDDLVAGTYSADILDYAQRDTLGIGMPFMPDRRLIDWGEVFASREPGDAAATSRDDRAEAVYRFGLSAATDGVQVLTSLISLIRIRYEITERVLYHPQKCAADALLDRALRTIDAVNASVSQASGPFAIAGLLRLGDDEFVKVVENEERLALGNGRNSTSAIDDLLARRLPLEVIRLDRRTGTGGLERHAAEFIKPAVRGRIERAICQDVEELSEHDIVFAPRPRHMQIKHADMLVEWEPGLPQSLKDIASTRNIAREVLELDNRYTELWSVSVYLRVHKAHLFDAARSAAQRVLSDPARLAALVSAAST